MNAIDLLKRQHREVEDLFEELEDAGEEGAKRTRDRICRQISDALAIHAELEEKLFYPESKQENTEELLRESVEEHLAMKRILADVVEGNVSDDEQLEAKMKVLQEQVEHHVDEEEKELFPKVKKSLSRKELEDLGKRMQALAEELELGGEPSKSIPGQTDEPAQI